MTDKDALLASICANPDEDTPRLIYADWLDENATGDADRARAEFIRVQVEKWNLNDNPKVSGQPASEGEVNRFRYLRSVEYALLTRYDSFWRGRGLHSGGYHGIWGRSNPQASVIWRRGFPYAVHVPSITDCQVRDYLKESGRPVWVPSPWITTMVKHNPTVQEVMANDQPYHHYYASDGSPWATYHNWVWNLVTESMGLDKDHKFVTHEEELTALARSLVIWARDYITPSQ